MRPSLLLPSVPPVCDGPVPSLAGALSVSRSGMLPRILLSVSLMLVLLLRHAVTPTTVERPAVVAHPVRVHYQLLAGQVAAVDRVLAPLRLSHHHLPAVAPAGPHSVVHPAVALIAADPAVRGHHLFVTEPSAVSQQL